MWKVKCSSELFAVLIILTMLACSKQEAPAPEIGHPSALEQKSTPTYPTQAESSFTNTRGGEVYEGTCFACHSTGVAGAPKLGDKAAWKDRIAKGVDALVQSTLNGKGNMPPKGGERTLDEKDIQTAVEYMVDQVR